MKENYLTIKGMGSHEIDIKKSQFICSINRISSEEEALAFINQIKENNKKATHNCYAYIIGSTDHIQRASDNGEPSGTAGVPILEALKKIGVHDVVAVVTRYFGGIKLGAGGLIRAYSNATTRAIENVGIVKKVLQTEIKITTNYKMLDTLNYHLKENNINIIRTDYTDKVMVVIAINNDIINDFKEKVINLLNDQVTMENGIERYFEIPFNPYQNNN